MIKTFLSFLCALCFASASSYSTFSNWQMHSCESRKSDKEDEKRRYYVVLTGLALNSKSTCITGTFFTSDGKKEEITGYPATSSTDEVPTDYRVAIFDTKNIDYEMSYFCIYSTGGQLWSQTQLYKINSNCFEYKTENYAVVLPATGWHNVAVNTKTFCEYFLSNIDCESPTKCGGFLEFENLKNAVFGNLLDFISFEKTNYYWVDKKSKEQTNFEYVWKRMESNFLSFPHNKENFNWKYVVGVLIICCITGLTIAPIIKEKIYAKRKKA